MKQADVCVIGAGPGGYVAAIKAAQLGKKVIIVEKEKWGGVCLNVGCIPSKALITAAHFYDQMSRAEEMGFKVGKVSVDFKKLQSWKQGVVNKLTGGVSQLLKANGCEAISGTAEFTSPQEIQVKSGNGGGVEKITATNFIIATGSRPIEIPGFAFDGKNIFGSTEALGLDEMPKKIVVIGGGYIGLEIGSFYQKFGVEVTIIEATKGLLTGVTDPDCAQLIARKLKKKGVNLIFNAKATGYKKSGSELAVTYTIEGKEEKVTCDKVLVTVGRRPNSDQLNAAKIGLSINQRGFFEVNKQMRTNIPHIFAIGDVAGQPMLAHKGMKEGVIAAEVIAGHNVAMDVKTIPAVIFTDPEIASAGMMVEEAQSKGYDVGVGQFPYIANGRALSMNEPEGFVKIVIDKKTKLVLGVHIVGAEASQMISEAALAIEMGATAEDIAATIHPHPTLPEMVMEAAEASYGPPIHIFSRPDRPLGMRPPSKSP
jgi:dihydrolipoamide dehydrogenase